MKRVGNLYKTMCTDRAILMAIVQSAKGKKRRRTVDKVLQNMDRYVDHMKDGLLNHTLKPSQPNIMIRYDNNNHKERRIQVVPYYPDGVLHRLIVNTIKPIIDKGMYQYSCGSMPDRGGHYAMRYLKHAIQTDPKATKYVLYFDIKKFFDSVPRTFTMKSLSMKIKDRELLALIEQILPEKGLPIGYYLSQWLSNFVLTQMDNVVLRHHSIRRDLRQQTAKYYARYVDDCVVLGNNKRQLHDLQKTVHTWLVANGLDMKHTWQVYPLSSRPVNYVGFLIYRRTVKMRKRNLYKLTKSAKAYKKKPEGFVSRYAYVEHTNSYLIKTKLQRKYNKAKKIISENAKALNKR